MIFELRILGMLWERQWKESALVDVDPTTNLPAHLFVSIGLNHEGMATVGETDILLHPRSTFSRRFNEMQKGVSAK